MKIVGGLVLVAAYLTSFASAIGPDAYGTYLEPRSVASVPVAQYSFLGANGPLFWSSMDPENNAACSAGTTQSPVNINSQTFKNVKGKYLDLYLPTYQHGADLENLGSTLEVNIQKGGFTRDGKRYKLRQFHFHTPSEHLIDGEHFPMEVHFVAQSEDQKLSVIGFPIEVSSKADSMSLFDDVFSNLNDVVKPGTRTRTKSLNFGDLSKHLEQASVYQYGGSLTTPPCAEGVKWNVVQKPVNMHYQTYQRVKKVMGFNARFIQNNPGGENFIHKSCSAH